MGQHNVKIAESRWKAALAKARSEGRTLTSVIDEALEAYVGEAAPAGPVRVRKPAVPQAAFSDPPVNPLPAPGAPRCGHPGRRVTGGWCTECQWTILPGGRFAERQR